MDTLTLTPLMINIILILLVLMQNDIFKDSIINQYVPPETTLEKLTWIFLSLSLAIAIYILRKE